MGVPPNHIETHGDFGIPHDLRNLHMSQNDSTPESWMAMVSPINHSFHKVFAPFTHFLVYTASNFSEQSLGFAAHNRPMV